MPDHALDAAPPFTRDSPLLRGAYEFARSSHHGSRRRAGTDIEHPVAVAELLAEAGFEERVDGVRKAETPRSGRRQPAGGCIYAAELERLVAELG